MTPISYHSSNLSLIALETMRLLVQVLQRSIDLLREKLNRSFFLIQHKILGDHLSMVFNYSWKNRST